MNLLDQFGQTTRQVSRTVAASWAHGKQGVEWPAEWCRLFISGNLQFLDDIILNVVLVMVTCVLEEIHGAAWCGHKVHEELLFRKRQRCGF